MLFKNALKKNRIFFDGGLGSLIMELGLNGEDIPDILNIKNPTAIQNIHLKYVNSGATAITTNTFNSNALKLQKYGYSVDEIYSSAIKNAKIAVKNSGKKVYIGADIGPIGKLLKPLGDIEFESAYDLFKEMAISSEKHGADYIHIETMTDTYELKCAILAVKENTTLPVVATVMVDDSGRMLTGANVETAYNIAYSLGVSAFGFNCGQGPKTLIPHVEKLFSISSLPIIVNPNAGLPKMFENGKVGYDLSSEDFAKEMQTISKYASCLGGCCGTTPEYIEKTIALCKNVELPKITSKINDSVCSGTTSVDFKTPKIIGERINPSGRPDFRKALKEGDLDYPLKEGVLQEKEGASILDVNVGVPGIDEEKTLKEVVLGLQTIVDTPLQIDTANLSALKSALRIVNGVPIINSVNGSDESLKNILPLVKKYGAMVIGLTMDEDGIPSTYEKRVEIAKKIIATAKNYGIKKERIIIDVLTMPIGAGNDISVTINALKEVKKMGVKTALGVSNVSFGLPSRDIVNAEFLAFCMMAGLDAPIINPLSAKMRESFYSANALLGKDKDFYNYSKNFNKNAVVETSNLSVSTLKDAVINGLTSVACNLVKERLTKIEPLKIINDELIPALDFVGEKFEKKQIFLPQLIKSAECAEKVFSIVRESILSSGGDSISKGKILIATVKGDVHDIGKNIVKVLLESYGFEVVDLGKDVEPQKVLEVAKIQNIKLVCLSALMTTTVKSMEQTITLVKSNLKGVKIMVGGAVLNEDYAKEINADKYAKDATEAVQYAKQIFNL